jgi:branched-chain amino acid transport system substrate-binding protein
MSKRLFALFSLLIVAAMVLTACGAAQTPTATEAPAETQAAQETTAPAVTEPAVTEPVVTEAPAETEAPQETTAPVSGEPEVCSSDEVGCAVIKPGDVIKIGMGAPMTGDYAAFGIDISQGASLALEDAGDLDGFKFELVAEDDQASPEIGAAVANKFVTDPNVVAIAGHIFSGPSKAATPIYEKAGIPMMSPSATNPDLTTSGSKVFNRLCFTDALQGKFAAEYLNNKLGFTKIAIMHDGSTYGQGLAEVVREQFTALGGEIVEFQAITPGESDYSAPLAAVAAKNPEALYFGGYAAEAVVLVNGMKSSGLTDVVFFGDDGTFGQDFLDRTGENGEGSYGTSLIPPSSPEKEEFDATYLAKFGVEAGKLSAFTWTAYDAAAVLASVIKSVAILGDDGNLYIPRGALVTAVRNVKDYKGLSGTVTCGTTGECAGSSPTFYIVQDNMWVPAQQ